MAASKKQFLCFPFVLLLIFTKITVLPVAYDHEDTADDSSVETQLSNLKSKLSFLAQRNDALEAQSIVDQRTIMELNSKLEILQKTNDEQKPGIQKTELAFQQAEEKIMKSKSVSGSVSKESVEVHGDWFLPRLAVHLHHFQSYIVMFWNNHGRAALDMTIEKALKKKAETENWVKPCIGRLKTQWSPIMKEGWVTLIVYLEQHAASLTTKIIETCHAYMSRISPYFLEGQKLIEYYIQIVIKFTEPYTIRVATVKEPHFNQAYVTLKPYTEKFVGFCWKFKKSAVTYYHQVQEMLKDSVLTRSLAKMELAWFVATAFLALPVIFLYKCLSAIFSKKTKKHIYSSPTPRRLK